MSNTERPLVLGYYQTKNGPAQLLQREGDHPSNRDAVKGGWYKAKQAEGTQSYFYIHESELTPDKRLEVKDEWLPAWARTYSKRVAGEISGSDEE